MQLGDTPDRNRTNLAPPRAALLARRSRQSETRRPSARRRPRLQITQRSLSPASDLRPPTSDLRPPSHLFPILRRRPRAVPRHRFHVALADRRGRRVLRPLLGADDSLPGPRQTHQRPRRPARVRPPRISAAANPCSCAPVSAMRGSRRPADEVTVLIEAPGQARRRVTLRRNPAAAGVFEGVLADLARRPISSPAGRAAIARRPARRALRRRRPARRTGAHRNGPRRPHRRRRNHARQVLHDRRRRPAPRRPARRPPRADRKPAANPHLEPLVAAVAFLACITTEWILRKRKGML